MTPGWPVQEGRSQQPQVTRVTATPLYTPCGVSALTSRNPPMRRAGVIPPHSTCEETGVFSSCPQAPWPAFLMGPPVISVIGQVWERPAHPQERCALPSS